MKLALIRRSDSQALHHFETVFEAPGGTIGRGRQNHLVLPDAPGSLCRVQAAVTHRDAAWHLSNLSSMSAVSVNGQQLGRGEIAPLCDGDEVAIGGFVLRMHDDAASGHAPQVDADVFSDLIGPGTLPVASVADLEMHPFDMESAASRNPVDPLAPLAGDTWRGEEASRDPLSLFPHTGEHGDPLFSDPTPAMLPAGDPLAGPRTGPIADALARGREPGREDTMRDDAPEYGNPMATPTIRR